MNSKKKGLTFIFNPSWQMQEIPGESTELGVYQPMAATRHTVYTILNSVQLPWGPEMQGVDNKLTLVLPPMAAVYDASIDIVWGMRTNEEVQKAVTEYIYGCGKYKYVGNSNIVVIKRIDLDIFLPALYATEDRQQMVNCEGCSALIQAISNIYGCNTRCLYIGNNFKVNKILFIGEEQMRYPDNPNHDFEFHCIITDGGVYVEPGTGNICDDACIEVQGQRERHTKA